MRQRSLPFLPSLPGLVALALCSAPLPALAGTDPTGNGTQPGLTFALQSPSSCRNCHGDYDATNNIEPWNTWAGSMMANAGRDPLFWAALDVANNDLPGVGEFCLRCHSPVGWLEEKVKDVDGAVGVNDPTGCSLLGSIDEADSHFAGLTCHVCHRMMENLSPPPGQDGAYFENGQFWIDDAACSTGSGEPCRRGPYDYTGTGFDPPHDWAQSDYHVSSDICGNCHNVTSPINTLIDEAGVDTGIPYPIERTFREWQQSDYGDTGHPDFATCTNCHMPDSQIPGSKACVLPASPDRTGDMPVHRLVGGNAWIPAVLRDEYGNLGRTAEYDASIAGAIAMLEGAAEIAVTAPLGGAGGQTSEIGVRVTNLSGHKLPTGYAEGRRMWIQVEARDAQDAVFWQSGAYDASTGVLTHDPQVKIYQSQQGVWDGVAGACKVADELGNHLFHFVLNNCVALDNRIPPQGFLGKDDDETRPVSYTYPETSPGSGILVHWDDTTYQVAIPEGIEGPITVEARLLFQTASKEYVEFLRDQAVDNSFPDDCIPRQSLGGGTPSMSRGELLFALWETYGRSGPVTMVVDSAAVELAIFADGFESGDTLRWTSTVP